MAETKPRLYLWDNVKSLLIILVVMGHFVTQYTGSNEFMQSAFIIIYSVHMPLFIFVSGLFSKSTFKNDRLNFNKVIAFIILYFLLKFVIFLTGHGRPFRPFYEGGIPWYMLAMAVWLCITFVIRKAPLKAVLPVSVILALAAGLFDFINSDFCLSRIIVFYPFFLLGFYLDPTKVAEKSRDRRLFAAAAVLIAALFVCAFVFREQLYLIRPLMVAQHPYSKLWNPSLGILLRAAWYAGATVLSAAIVCLLPNKKNRLSYIGASTLPIYFFHRPILYLLMDAGFGDLIMYGTGAGPVLAPILFLLCAVVLALLLSFPQLNIPFNKLMKIEFIKRKAHEN